MIIYNLVTLVQLCGGIINMFLSIKHFIIVVDQDFQPEMAFEGESRRTAQMHIPIPVANPVDPPCIILPYQ